MVARLDRQVKLSVVMPTYNSAETIRETLRHLAEQDLDSVSYEVVVVADGPPDRRRAVVDKCMSRTPFRLSYLHHSNHGSGYTQSRGPEVHGHRSFC
jgi:glycosyltransferase involved in cell wall biosynthesis